MANSSTLSIDNDHIEKTIIYHCLTSEPYMASVVDHLDPVYFDDNNIKSIIRIITSFFEENGKAPTLTEIKTYLSSDELKERFRKVVGYIEGFDTNFDEGELYRNTERFLKEKAVYYTMLEVTEEYGQTLTDPAEILPMFEKSCNIDLSLDMGLDYFNDINKHIDDIRSVDSYISTGWDWLDDKLSGGLAEYGRALYVFLGQPNIGKSICLGNLACNIVSQGKTVVLVSLEMSELMYAKRTSSKFTQIPMRDLKDRVDDLQNKIEYYMAADVHKDSRLIIKEFPPNAITCGQLKGYLTRLKHRGVKPDAVVVDYLNLLRAVEGNNLYEKIKDISQDLRALSYIFECPFVTASQLNRQGFNTVDPGLESTSESAGLPATADAMMSLWQEEEDAELGVIKMGMMKNRFGANFGGTTFNMNYSTLTMTEDPTADLDDEMTNMNPHISALALLASAD